MTSIPVQWCHDGEPTIVPPASYGDYTFNIAQHPVNGQLPDGLVILDVRRQAHEIQALIDASESAVLVLADGLELDQKAALYEAGAYDVVERHEAHDELPEAIVTANASLEADAQRLAELRELQMDQRALQREHETLRHDVAGPITGLRQLTDLLHERLEDRLQPAEAAMFEQMRNALEGLREHLDRVGALARLERGTLHKQKVDLEQLVESAVQPMQALMAAEGGELQTQQLPRVIADGDQLVILLRNLIGNAIKYRSDAPPRIFVSAHLSGGDWLIRVRDNGRGFSSKDAHRLFEPFERGDNVGNARGEGIGLALCKRIVEAHGGRIWARSKPGMGATFAFLLPGSSA